MIPALNQFNKTYDFLSNRHSVAWFHLVLKDDQMNHTGQQNSLRILCIYFTRNKSNVGFLRFWGYLSVWETSDQYGLEY